MAIDSINGRLRAHLPRNTETKPELEPSSVTSSKASAKTDSVAITSMAQDIKKALATSSSADVVDMERVAAVKKALSDGSYRINPEKIAAKMIEQESLMSRRQRDTSK